MAKATKKKRPEKISPLTLAKRAKAGGRKADRAGLLTSGMPGADATVLDRLAEVVLLRREANPAVSHSARLLARGTDKVAQKFGEEAVECLIEAIAGRRDALIGESADVLYHLIVLWVDAGVRPDEVWAELKRREGVSGIAEKASRAKLLPRALGLSTTKIP